MTYLDQNKKKELQLTLPKQDAEFLQVANAFLKVPPHLSSSDKSECNEDIRDCLIEIEFCHSFPPGGGQV